MNPTVAAAIARARQQLAAREQANKPTYGQQRMQDAKLSSSREIVLNDKQNMAVELALSGKSFCLVGSAGTGKTTSTREIIRRLMQSNLLPTIEKDTKYLRKGSPGVALIAYTRRAVRNIAKQMPDDFKPHCVTYHKLVEYEPEVVETLMPDGKYKISKPFLPQRKPGNTLPRNLRTVFIDEASMLSIDFWKILARALPSFENVQFIFIGDINQLPPVYGDGILGVKLNTLPVVELTEVYRQALESPIIEMALYVKDNNLPPEYRVITKDVVKETPRGKVTLVPWKKKLSLEEAEQAIHNKLTDWVMTDQFNIDEDVILCPWGKSFGTVNMNKSIGTALARKADREVYEVIAGFNKHYFSVGDRVMFDKRDARIVKIAKNARYIGKQPQLPSRELDYFGWSSGAATALIEELNVDELLSLYSDATEEDRTREASHALTVQFLDDETEYIINSAAEVNVCDLGYAMSVHKSQGSEWKRVIVILHDVHTKMIQRELIYTAMTRASEELYMILPPMALQKAASRPKIKGDTLADKLKYFAEKHKENDIEDYEDH